VPEAKITRLNEKIATLRQEMQRLNGLNTLMMQTEDKQISLTDPDARSMATSGRGSGIVGSNVQSAVSWEKAIEKNNSARPWLKRVFTQPGVKADVSKPIAQVATRRLVICSRMTGPAPCCSKTSVRMRFSEPARIPFDCAK
jgi:hypothetical protein